MAYEQMSFRKYVAAPMKVPKCSATSKVFSVLVSPAKSFQLNSHGTISRWPLDEIGKNSVSPWVIPRTIAWKMGIR